MTSSLSGGSVWRRWEPHIHMPGTLLNNQYGATTISQALDALAACQPTIEVVGITDYFTTQSFRRAEDAWRSGAGAGIVYMFPNVELRLNDATARGNGVNVHVLSSAEDVDLLDEMLGRLTFTFADREYSATLDGLAALGRAYSGTANLSHDAAVAVGANQYKVSYEQLRGLLQRDAGMRERLVVAMAAGADGTSGLKDPDGGFVGLPAGVRTLRSGHLHRQRP